MENHISLLYVLNGAKSKTGVRRLETMHEQDYVQTNKLIVLVESVETQAILFESMLLAAGFQGSLKTFKRTESAVSFLNKNVSENGLLAAADLLFFSFDILEHDIMQVINSFSAEVQENDKVSPP